MRLEKPEEWGQMTRQQRRQWLEARDGPCLVATRGVHSDPDNSGLCIHCGCILDAIEDDDLGDP